MKWKKMFNHRKNGMVVTNEKKVSLRFLLSYLVIMAAPAIAIVVVYFTASSALLDVQKEKTFRLLSESVITFDRQLEEIRNVGYYTGEQKELKEFLKDGRDKEKEEKFFELYTIARSFPNYKLINQSVGNIYILIKGMDYVIRVPAVIPTSEIGITTLDNFEKDNFDEMLDSFCKDYTYGDYVNIKRTYGGDNALDLAMVLSLPGSVQNYYQGAVVVTYEKTALKNLLQRALLDDRGLVVVTDENDQIICSEAGQANLSREVMGKTLDEVTSSERMGAKALRYSIKSQYNAWTFTVLMPYNALLGNIGSIKYLIIILCVTSIAIGVCICLAYWYRRKNTIKRYMIFNEGLGEEKTTSFWGGFNDFLGKVEDLQITVTRQQTMLHKEILRKLLYGEYDTQEEIWDELGEKGEAFCQARGYYIVMLQYEDPLKNKLYTSKREFQNDVEQHLASQLERVHWIYEVSQLSYVVIVADNGEVTPEALKEEFEKLNYYFYKAKPLQIFTGISNCIEEILQLASALEEAANICEYARMLGIRVPLLKEDFPGEQEAFVFPIDMEMQLEQIIRRGSKEEMEKQIKDIREYYLNGLQDYRMLHHILEILKCTIIRSLEKARKESSVREILEQVKKAKRPDEVFEAMHQANAYYALGKNVWEDENLSAMKQNLAACIEEYSGDAGFNLAVLADCMNIGERRLYKEFKDYFGVTFSEYLEQFRIRNACTYLKEGMPVKEVAVKAGYGSDYSFRRAFKRVIGIPPSDFQKNHI